MGNEIQKHDDVKSLLDNKIKETQDEKSAINLLATRTALMQDDTVGKIVNEKKEELINDAFTKKVIAETKRVEEEVKKVEAEKRKQIAELDKVISEKQKEIEQLKADSDKSQAFFEANKDILSYINIKSKKTLGVMRFLMVPATIVFMLVLIITLPITIAGAIVRAVVHVIGSICETIKNYALKVIISAVVVILIIALVIGAIYLGNMLVHN